MLACTWLQETDKIPFHLERRTQLQQTYPDAVNACSTDIKCDILRWSLFFPAPGEACRGVGDPPGVSGCGAGSQEPGHVVLSDFAVGEHRTSHQQLSGHHRQAAHRGSNTKMPAGKYGIKESFEFQWKYPHLLFSKMHLFSVKLINLKKSGVVCV